MKEKWLLNLQQMLVVYIMIINTPQAMLNYVNLLEFGRDMLEFYNCNLLFGNRSASPCLGIMTTIKISCCNNILHVEDEIAIKVSKSEEAIQNHLF